MYKKTSNKLAFIRQYSFHERPKYKREVLLNTALLLALAFCTPFILQLKFQFICPKFKAACPIINATIFSQQFPNHEFKQKPSP